MRRIHSAAGLVGDDDPRLVAFLRGGALSVRTLRLPSRVAIGIVFGPMLRLITPREISPAKARALLADPELVVKAVAGHAA